MCSHAFSKQPESELLKKYYLLKMYSAANPMYVLFSLVYYV